MTRSTVKRLTKPLDKLEREFRRLRRAALRSHQNESLAIAGRNLFDEEASSSNNTEPKPPTHSKTLHEHSHPTPSGFQNPITFPTEQIGRMNDDTSPWGNSKRKEKGEDGPEWIIRTTDNFTNGETEKEGPGDTEPSITQEPAPQPSILYQPSKASKLPFLSILKKQNKDDGDERLLSIFKQIHISLSFLEAMIHMPKGAKVLKDLLSHKEKLENAASLVKLSEECSAIIQRSLSQKEGDP
ncbi:hypothetical protein Tco_0215470 [Tanacetum coccineum]